MSEHAAERDAGPTDAQVEAAARAIHAHQEYSTCWDDEQAGSLSHMGTRMRPLGDHGRGFYRGLALAALSAVFPAGLCTRQCAPGHEDATCPVHGTQAADEGDQ